MNPKISILLPVFNAGLYLEECLDSIVQQTEERWELLAINDFSTDNSLEILERYAAKDSRISIFNNFQKGIIPALRLAFAKSTGQVITRMDADDKMTVQKLAVLKKILLENGQGFLATGLVKYFSAQPLGGGYLRYEKWLNELTKESQNYTAIYRECVIPSPCWMLWRQDLIKCSAFDPNTYPEDYDLCFRFYENDMKVVGSPEVLHHWRDYDERSSRNDPHYANQQYFSLKMPYFLKLDRKSDRPLVLWGAGKKGKLLAKMLSETKEPFRWICNSPSKWGHKVSGVVFENIAVLKGIKNPQIIIAVGKPEDQTKIKEYLKVLNLKSGADYFFFC